MRFEPAIERGNEKKEREKTRNKEREKTRKKEREKKGKKRETERCKGGSGQNRKKEKRERYK